MKKRTYSVIAMVGLCALMLVGCGDKKATTGEAVSDTEAAELAALDYKVKDYVKLGDYKNLEVKYPVPTVTEDDMGIYISELIDENTEYNEIKDRGAADGDSVNIDFNGTIDGEEFDGGSAEDYEFILGAGEFLDEFESSIQGKMAGESVTFPVTFPEDYYEDMAGKTAEFTVTVNSVSEVITPEYTDAFVAEVTDYETIEEYEEALREELLLSAQEEAKTAAGEDALAQAIENAEIKGYPEALFDVCYKDTKASYESYAEMFGMEYEEFMSEFMDGEDLEETTKSWVYEILVSQAIAEKEGYDVSDKDYESEAEKLAIDYGYASLEDFEEDYGKLSIMTTLIREKTIDFLYENAKVEEVSEDEYYGDDEDEYVDEEDTEEILDTEVLFMDDTE